MKAGLMGKEDGDRFLGTMGFVTLLFYLSYRDWYSHNISVNKSYFHQCTTTSLSISHISISAPQHLYQRASNTLSMSHNISLNETFTESPQPHLHNPIVRLQARRTLRLLNRKQMYYKQ